MKTKRKETHTSTPTSSNAIAKKKKEEVKQHGMKNGVSVRPIPFKKWRARRVGDVGGRDEGNCSSG